MFRMEYLICSGLAVLRLQQGEQRLRLELGRGPEPPLDLGSATRIPGA
jgi:hypothetical protein